MTEGLGFEPEDEKPDGPVGWVVLDPDGNVVGSGGQTVTEAGAGAGEET
jgi:tRNA(Arg) A34 adenosine deaminase TadA